MTYPRSGLYVGTVRHVRSRPHAHSLSYRVFSLFLDLEEIDRFDRECRLFSQNRFGLFSFRNEDFGDGSARPLKAQITDILNGAGITVPADKVCILTYPRVLGYVFNPLTVYYIYGLEEGLHTLVYEVTNTFRERVQYVLPVCHDSDAVISQTCRKELYVSPFTAQEGVYDFRLSAPAEQVSVSINFSDCDGPLLNASFRGRWQPLCDSALLRLASRIPFLSFKVVSGIHLEALKLWLKGNPVFRHKAAQRYRVVAPDNQFKG